MTRHVRRFVFSGSHSTVARTSGGVAGSADTISKRYRSSLGPNMSMPSDSSLVATPSSRARCPYVHSMESHDVFMTN